MKTKFLIVLFAWMILSAAVSAARADDDFLSFSRESFRTEASLREPSVLEKYLLQPSDQIKLAKYISLLPPMMRDRTQTLQLGERGFDENNPLLGRHPSNAKINSYFFLYTLSLFAVSYLPEPLASPILDSVRYQEEIVIDENDRLFNRKAMVTGAPIAFMFTIVY